MDHLILKFHQSGYKMIDILATLAFNYGYDISLSTLKRRFKKLNLKRYNCESPLTEIVSKIQDEVQTSGQLLGYRALWLRLNVNYGLRATQQTVAKALKLIDPEGVAIRTARKFRRRKYKVPGPNHIWHIDGYDKLTPYGFPIHGAIDGYSRNVIWLKV